MCVCQPYVVCLMHDRSHHSAGTARQQQIHKATKPVARSAVPERAHTCRGRCGPACAGACRPSQFRRVSEASLLPTLPGARLRGLEPRAASQHEADKGKSVLPRRRAEQPELPKIPWRRRRGNRCPRSPYGTMTARSAASHSIPPPRPRQATARPMRCRHRAAAHSTGSCSSSPTCRPGSVRSSPST